MVFACAVFLILAVLQNASEGSSFRSSWNDGGKPILRGGNSNDDNLDGNNNNDSEDSPHNNDKAEEQKWSDTVEKPNWMKALRSGISALVQMFGYDSAKSHIKNLVDETENKNNVLLYVKGNIIRGKAIINYKKFLREGKLPGLSWPPTPPPPPTWLLDFKEFIKNLIERYGRRNLDEHLRPVVKYVETLHNVQIQDIDGEVLVSFVQRPTPV